MARIGVFICWCGENIARNVDVEQAARPRPPNCPASLRGGLQIHVLRSGPVADPPEDRRRAADGRRDRLLLAAHALADLPQGGRSGRGSIRTWSKWPTSASTAPGSITTARRPRPRPCDLIRMAVAKVRCDHALQPIRVPVTRRALVIGGGVAGIQAALDIADAGYQVVLVEREPSIGGKMAGLSETFPTLDCSQCILTPRMVDVGQHPHITLHTYSEIESVEGYVGNFQVTIRKKARYVDVAKCTGCGQCWNVLPLEEEPQPVRLRHGHAHGDLRAFSRRPCPPGRSSTATPACISAKASAASAPRSARPARSVFDDQDRLVTEEVGAIVVATGYQLYSIGKHADQRADRRLRRIRLRPLPGRDRLARSSSGWSRPPAPPAARSAGLPTGRRPRRSCFISCVGSRDNAKGISYCSKICCMYTAKHTMLYKHKVHDGQAHVFYMDIRAGGKNYDEFVRRAIEQDGAQYHRGRVSKITRGKRQADRPRRRYAGRRAADDRGRPGGAGRGHAARRRRRGTGPEAQRGLRRVRLPLRIASQAAAGGNQRRRGLRLRRLPGPEGHSRVGGPGLAPRPARCW